jgi:RNA polymerase sigma-70 factor (ECF subfamily)
MRDRGLGRSFSPAVPEKTTQMVTPLTFVGGDTALVQALRAGHPGAAAAFYDQHSAHVYRALRSAIGPDDDLPDLLQEVFIRAIDQIDELQDLGRVRGWLTGIAIFTARGYIRRRARRKWLSVFSPANAASRQQEPPPSDARRALREIYGILGTLPTDERLAFVLRIVEGLSLPEAAEVCGVSLATIKRRLQRAERRFVEMARGRPELEPWLEKGTRWTLGNQG